jgi:hypothetical protein
VLTPGPDRCGFHCLASALARRVRHLTNILALCNKSRPGSYTHSIRLPRPKFPVPRILPGSGLLSVVYPRRSSDRPRVTEKRHLPADRLRSRGWWIYFRSLLPSLPSGNSTMGCWRPPRIQRGHHGLVPGAERRIGLVRVEDQPGGLMRNGQMAHDFSPEVSGPRSGVRPCGQSGGTEARLHSWCAEGASRPRARARSTAPVRLWAASFSYRCRMCVRTVFTDRVSSLAISGAGRLVGR